MAAPYTSVHCYTLQNDSASSPSKAQWRHGRLTKMYFNVHVRQCKMLYTAPLLGAYRSSL